MAGGRSVFIEGEAAVVEEGKEAKDRRRTRRMADCGTLLGFN